MKSLKSMAILLVVILFSFVALAATIDLTVGGGSGYSAAAAPAAFLVEKTYDFSATDGKSTNVYQVIDIPAGTYVLGVGYKVVANATGLVGEDSTCTIDIGDGTDPDGWVDGANVLTGQVATAYCSWSTPTLTVGVTNGITGYTAGKFYQTADTIDLILVNNATTLKITVKALVVPAAGL